MRQIYCVLSLEHQKWKIIKKKLLCNIFVFRNFCQPKRKTENGMKSSYVIKVSFFGQCSKMQLIPIKKFNIKTCFIQFLCSFRLKCWFKGQIISRIHLSLPNAYKLMCFDRNINGNRDVKFLIGIIGHCTDERNLF